MTLEKQSKYNETNDIKSGDVSDLHLSGET